MASRSWFLVDYWLSRGSMAVVEPAAVSFRPRLGAARVTAGSI